MSDFEYTDENASPSLQGRFEDPVLGQDQETENDLVFNDGSDPDKKVLTLEEWDRLNRQQDRDSKLDNVLAGLTQAQQQTAGLLAEQAAERRAANAPREPEELDRAKLVAEVKEKILSNEDSGEVVVSAAEKLAGQMISKKEKEFNRAIQNLQNNFSEMVVGSVTSDPSAQVVMDLYKDEVNTIINNMPADQRTNKQMIRNAVNFVKAQHIEEPEFFDRLVAARNGTSAQTVQPAKTAVRQQQTYTAKPGASTNGENRPKVRLNITEAQASKLAEQHMVDKNDPAFRAWLATNHGRKA